MKALKFFQKHPNAKAEKRDRGNSGDSSRVKASGDSLDLLELKLQKQLITV